MGNDGYVICRLHRQSQTKSKEAISIKLIKETVPIIIH